MSVVGEAASGDEAVAMAKMHRPDVVLMVLRMPGGDGVQATRGILSTAPGTRVVVLTTYEIENDSRNRRQWQRAVTDAGAKIDDKLGSRHSGSLGDAA
jgi:DNA-binding NarL/FixJ family response regulator